MKFIGYIITYLVGRFIFWLIVLVLDLIVSYLFSRVMNEIKEDKGYYNNFHFFAICFWLSFLGWFITATIVIALPDLRLQEEIRVLNNKMSSTIGGNANGSSAPEKEAIVNSLGDAYSPKSNNNNDDPYYKSLFKDNN